MRGYQSFANVNIGRNTWKEGRQVSDSEVWYDNMVLGEHMHFGEENESVVTTS
jgi:hypothetical protein